MKHSSRLWAATIAAALFSALLASGTLLANGWDPRSKASNLGSIVNTRHNLTMSYLGNSMWRATMDYWRNNYGQVCVYCHTPHGTNTTLNAPLWNRTNKGNTYTLYNAPLTSGQTATQPGVNSLTCLSCHDGTVAVDSIVNMPGSGNYSTAQQTSQSDAFLDTWTGTRNPGDPHFVLGAWVDANNDGWGDTPTCTNCHSKNGLVPIIPFDAFVIGTDLTNDHPIGVRLPETLLNSEFNAPTVTTPILKFYDKNGNQRADSNEIRFYNTGEGYEVECASCHDPHGVPSGGPGTNSLLQASFLRASNSGSAVCLTCHNK